MTNEEKSETVFAMVKVTGSVLKTIITLTAIRNEATKSDEIAQLDELIMHARDMREAQIEAGQIFKRARAARRAKR